MPQRPPVIRSLPAEPGADYFRALERAVMHSIPKPLAVVVCYPSNPTATVASGLCGTNWTSGGASGLGALLSFGGCTVFTTTIRCIFTDPSHKMHSPPPSAPARCWCCLRWKRGSVWSFRRR